MRSGHGSPRQCSAASAAPVALAALVWGLVTLCAAVAVAQPQVACVHPGNPELVTRIRGQTRDLPIRLAYVNAQLGVSPSAEALQALAAQHAAQLVVQVSTLANGAHAVLVYDAERRALRKRDVPAPSRKERMSRSATAGTIALIVRGELSDALRARAPEPQDNPSPAGPSAASSGAAGSSGANAAKPAEDTPRTPPAEEERPAPPPPAAEPDELPPETGVPDTGPSWLAPRGFVLGLGARAASAAEDRVFLAVLLALALRFQHVELGVSASSSLNDALETQALKVTLREHTASAELMLRIPLTGELELSLGPGAGVVVYQRNVTSADPSWLLVRNDRTHVSATVGARAQLQLRFTRHFAAALRMGVDYMLRPLRFQFALEADPTNFSEVSRLNAIQPWATLSLLAEL